MPVVARLSKHTLRLEREYQLFRSFVASADPECGHTVKVVELVKLPGRQGDEDKILISIFESPGRSYLPSLIDFGRAWLTPSLQQPFVVELNRPERELISLQNFFRFAIGACECLELLHHGIRVVHGEIRGDAFHFNRDTGAVKFVNFGAGVRTFEGDFSSAGWSKLSRELGVENKLQFIAPEQTGRMSVEPESRTDIYSLGVLFWVLLTRNYPFEGVKALDIIHAVLNRRIPSVSSKRIDIPEIVSQIVQKMTQKQIDDRYNSISGLKYDLVEAERILGEGDTDAQSNFAIASKDPSSFFKIPSERFGRSQEFQQITDAVDKLSLLISYTARRSLRPKAASASGPSADLTVWETTTRTSDTDSYLTREEDETKGKGAEGPKPPMESSNSKTSMNSIFSRNTRGSVSGISNYSHQGSREKRTPRLMCHVITVAGAAGMGKSSLLQDAQSYVRKRGFSAYIKFDSADKAPYEPLRRGLSSLFRQIFSESVSEGEIQSEYYEQIRRNVSGYWTSLSTMLDLPFDLLGTEYETPQHGPSLEPFPEASVTGHHQRPSPRPDAFDAGSIKSDAALPSPYMLGPSYQNHPRGSLRGGIDSSTFHGGFRGSQGMPITSDFPCGVTNTKLIKMRTIFVEVLRVLSNGKLICLCVDDMHAADDESLDLIANIIEKGLNVLIVSTCSHDVSVPAVIETALSKGNSIFEKIVLTPLTEADAIDLISATTHRPKEYIAPLALVCLEKSDGNPFFVKHMLETAYRKGCIWFTWKDSLWEYDLDKIFAEFKSESYGERFSIDCITKRLLELPPVARSILAWASLLGKTFSFSMVQRLLSGEFDYYDTSSSQNSSGPQAKVVMRSPESTANFVEGLQIALDAFILVPCDDEDHFRYVLLVISLTKNSRDIFIICQKSSNSNVSSLLFFDNIPSCIDFGCGRLCAGPGDPRSDRISCSDCSRK